MGIAHCALLGLCLDQSGEDGFYKELTFGDAGFALGGHRKQDPGMSPLLQKVRGWIFIARPGVSHVSLFRRDLVTFPKS